MSTSSPSLPRSVDHASVIRRGLAAVKKHVKANKALLIQEDGDKQTLLHVAATEGDLDTMNWLLKLAKPSDLKRRDKTGWTPLHAAGHVGNLELYETLLRKGASPNAQNAHLTSPFVYLCRHAPMGTEPMTAQFLNLLDLNVERGVDIDCQNTNGDTALHDSTSRGMVELTRYLLAKGANPNLMNRVGETPLHKAVQCRVQEVSLILVKLLVEQGADVSVCGLTGSPLTIAIMHDNTPVANFLKARRPQHSAQASNAAASSPTSTSTKTTTGEACADGDDTATMTATPSTEASKTDDKSISSPRTSSNSTSGTAATTTANPTIRVHGSNPFGPSYDNLDLATLLGIRPSSGGGGPIVTTQKPGPDDIVEHNDGFNFELGTPIELVDDLADLKIDDDTSTFDYESCAQEDIVNILGIYKLPRTKDLSRTGSDIAVGKNVTDDKSFWRRLFCISVLKAADNGKMRCLIRTQTGDHRFYIPVTALKEKNGKSLQPKDILKELQKEIPELDLKGISKCVLVPNPGLQAELSKFEQSKSIQSSRMKIGVLYAKKGQKTEQEIFGNEHGSSEFEAFLRTLGDVIKLEGWEGFKGDLDVKHNRTGLQSVHTTFRKTEIMFHVSTYLPHNEEDEQQIAKKRCIGNDLTTIIFLEEGAVFKPPCVSGDFLHIFAAVQPATTKEGKPGFRVAFSSREGVPNFGPMLPKPAIFAAEGPYFRDFLLAKLINGERASLHSDFLISKMIKTRQFFLESLVQEFAPSLDD